MSFLESESKADHSLSTTESEVDTEQEQVNKKQHQNNNFYGGVCVRGIRACGVRDVSVSCGCSCTRVCGACAAGNNNCTRWDMLLAAHGCSIQHNNRNNVKDQLLWEKVDSDENVTIEDFQFTGTRRM